MFPVPRQATILLDRPADTTFECLGHHANATPLRPALVLGEQSYSFLRFHSDALRFSAAVAAVGVTRGQLVLVSHPHLYVHWLLLIACENLGAVSASYGSSDEIDSPVAFARADHVFAESPTPRINRQASFHALDKSWIEATFRHPLPEIPWQFPAPLGPHDAQRLTHSSGTTGAQKAMLLTWGAQEVKLRLLQESSGLTPATRLLVTLPFAVNSAYLLATLCLRMGALVVAAPLESALALHQVTYCEVLPLMLERMLRELPPERDPPYRLSVKVIGAPLTEALRAAALRSLCTEISGRYATNEAWPIASDMNVEQEGVLFPGVEVRILDDRGQDVAAGQPGQIVVRTPALVDGFVDDPDANRAQFHDGWFLTGDVGQLLGSRRLRLHGRADDVLNWGGVKLRPDPIETRIRKVPGVREAAVTSISQGQAIDTLCIGVVVDGDCEPASVEPLIRASVHNWPTILIRFLTKLPVTTNAKLSRVLLRRKFQACPLTPPGCVGA